MLIRRYCALVSPPRVVAVGLVRRPSDGAFLVTVGEDGGRRFARLIGGSVEFGETAAQAVAREFLEEFGTEIAVGERVAVVENLFSLAGQRGHEVVIVHEVLLQDGAAEAGPITAVEPGHPDAVWLSAC